MLTTSLGPLGLSSEYVIPVPPLGVPDSGAGADSVAMLAEATRRVRAAGWEPGNIDASVVTDHPKLAPARVEMQTRLSDAVGAPVTVKGRRPEGLGSLGRGEGVAC